jgi:radical SAM superfamily enzyme YgiQ (UPF0313 family)
MIKKILLLNPPAPGRYIRDFYCSFSSKANYYWPPQDLVVLSGILSSSFEVEALDAVASRIKEEVCLERILKSPAEAVIFATGSVSFAQDLAFIKRLKKNKDIKAIGSGSIFRFLGKEILQDYPFLDALISDFTDKGIVRYLAGDYAGCQGISYRDRNEIHIAAQPSDAVDFEVGIPPHELFASRSNRLPFFGDSGFAVVVTSFGCNFSCGFCVAGQVALKKRSLPEVLDELSYISKLGIKKVFFADPNFTAQNERVLEFCANLENRNIKLGWVCNAHSANLINEEMLKAMKEAGCLALMIGVESSSDEILRKYKKGTSAELLRKAFGLCRKLGIKTLGYFIIGLPGEDKSSVQRTIEFAKELDCDYASFGYATADIGTGLREEVLASNRLSSAHLARIDSSTASNILSDKLSDGELGGLMRSAYRQFYFRPGYLARKILEARTPGDIRFLAGGGLTLLKKNFW